MSAVLDDETVLSDLAVFASCTTTRFGLAVLVEE